MELKKLNLIFAVAHFLAAISKGIETGRPNIVLLLADDLGYGDLSYSGHPTSYTPNIDSLARGGRFLSKFYTTSPVCSPSRSSILTGKYFVRSGIYPGTFTPDSYLGLPRNETTLASMLKELGYATHMVGKWHLGVGLKKEYLPTNFGFDNYLGVPYSHDMCPCKSCFPNNGTCLSQCWEWDVSCPLFRNEIIEEQPVHLPTLTEKFVLDAQRFISRSDKREEPFFLYFAFHQIHHPQFASSKFFKKSVRGSVGDALLEMDWAVGELIHVLKHLNILNNTLIWFTSDNGPSLQRHERGGCAGLLRCGKGTTMEGGIRVPAIAYWKGKITPGKRSGLMSAMDILPTTLSFIGLNTSDMQIDGLDQSYFIMNLHEKSQRDFLAIYPMTPIRELGPFAVAYKNYKAHFYTQGSDLSDNSNFDPICPQTHNLTKHDPPLLFNLNDDPSERYNLAKKEDLENILTKITIWRDNHMNNTEWMQARTNKVNKFAEPCCTDPRCENFPGCCDCP